ncbi:carbohydrate porin [Shewanella avicenniae]|uniref:Carbohydrate porin n=1 Tax=Shewanella avicenniae TaxID=2814294 RepID=A0ABX7QQW5_9GAMM|nr:carbohydrate porin [Shewanella avicenniae]QSX33857.1 carbohydrate porin [Shewanella avicenniae]
MSLKKSLSVASALWLSSALSVVSAEQFNADNYLTGDLGGVRSQLHDQGVDLQLMYIFETGTNVKGGQSEHEYSYADQTIFGVDTDLEKLFDLKGASFHAQFVNRGGQSQNLSGKAETGQLLQSLEVYGRGRTTRISAFYYEQKLFNDQLNVKLGRMGVSSQFASFRCEMAYLGGCSSQPGNFNGTIYNFPIAPWAAVVNYQFNTEWYLRVGAFQMNPSWLTHGQRLNFLNASGTEGVTLPVELGWNPSINNLPGVYKLGFWHDNVGGDDLYFNQAGEALALNGGAAKRNNSRNGAYFVVDQQLTSEDGSAQGLSLFSMGTLNDRDMTTVDRSLIVGLSYKGLFDGRDDDNLGLAAHYLHVSQRLADGERLQLQNGQLVNLQNDEWGVSAYYTMQVTPFFKLHPEVQFLGNPGGTSANSDVWVAVIRGDLTF